MYQLSTRLLGVGEANFSNLVLVVYFSIHLRLLDDRVSLS